MGNRLSHPARVLLAGCILVGAVAATTSAASAAPGPHANPHTAPSIPSVQRQLGRLALLNDQLVEQYNEARLAVGKQAAAVVNARRAVQTSDAAYAKAHVVYVRMVQAQLQGDQSFGAAAALLTSRGGSNYLDRLTTLNAVTAQKLSIVTKFTNARETASAASKKAARALTAVKHKRAVLEAKRAATQRQINKYRQVLSTLSAVQRAAFESHGQVSRAQLTHLTTPTSAAARRAVDFALMQVGKPYIFGAAGPNAFDCSGLTLAAWHLGTGVNLPHSAAVQYNYGHHVARNALMPGDLLFFYRPIDHVTIYIGDGLMVSAPTEGMPVEVVPVAKYESDYVGATRLRQ